jgi:hypothetical protein
VKPRIPLTPEEIEQRRKDREQAEMLLRLKMRKVLLWLRRPQAQMPKESIFGVTFRTDGRPRVRVDFLDDFDQDKWTDETDRSTGMLKRQLAYVELKWLTLHSEERGCTW